MDSAHPLELSFRVGEHGAPRPPQVAGTAVLGNLHDFQTDRTSFFLSAYREHGPVFRIRMGPKRFVVLCGAEANQLVGKREREFLASTGIYDKMAIFGADPTEMAPNVDGKVHQELRAGLQVGLTRSYYESHLDTAKGAIQEVLETIEGEDPLDGSELAKQLVFSQMSRLCYGTSIPAEYVDDIETIASGMVQTQTKPWTNYLPMPLRLRRSLQRLRRLAQDIKANVEQSADRSPDRFIVNRLITYNRAKWPPKTLPIAVFPPFLAGLDTLGGSLAFMIYALASHPKALEAVTSEINEALDAQPLTASALRGMRCLRGAMLETLRLYPVSPGVQRYVTRPVEVGGYQLEEREMVLLPHALPHLMAEHFPRPEAFDIDRFEESRSIGRVRGAFAPFGLGAHACLGSGFSEVSLQATVALILRRFRIELDPPNYDLNVSWDPMARPEGMRIRFRPRALEAARGLAAQEGL